MDLADFAASRQEDQNVARISIECISRGADHGIEIETIRITRQVIASDRIGTAFAGDEGRVTE